MMELSPYHIEIMFACYSCYELELKFGTSRWENIKASTHMKFLLDNELVNSDFRATEKGTFWVKMICSTPQPVFCDPRDIKE